MRNVATPGRSERLLFWGAVVLLTGLHTTTFRITEDQQERLDGTRMANVRLAYNLRHHAIFSVSVREPEARAHSAYRPPAYPAYLALGMGVVPGLERHGLRHIGFHATSVLGPVYVVQKLTLLLTAYLAMLAVWLTTRNCWLSLLPFPCICHTPLWLMNYRSTLNDYTNLFYPTPLATLLITALGLSLWITIEKQRYWQFALTGLVAGALALTRASFQYYVFLGALALGVWLWRRPERRRFLAPRVACCVGLALVLVFGWMARNQHHFGRFFVAERGGYQLNVRAQMLDMDRTTYFASFLYWSNSRFLEKTLLERMIGDERRRHVERKLNSGSPTSFKRQAKLAWNDYREQYASSVEADRVLLSESVDAIRGRPLRHLLISIPLLHRGICVEQPYGLSLLLALAFLGVSGMAIARRQFASMAMLSPAVFCLAFNTILTNNLPRYNVLLIPLLWVAVAIALQRVISIVRNARAPRAE